ncbi:hypothetical protein BGW38_003459 [Lunasporangiospora selenospora]|uniref:Pre-rRNA-processing protein RIX1 n=1 Tax=Lunasporangiospora selenospora TaxID=979761 RepID=A0A9P6KCP1_9FUNG|nr:hypothetical protein BGW38_003459 [Lunasporangiospora selenospora]
MASVVQATPSSLLDTLNRRYLKDDLMVHHFVPQVIETITHYKLLHDRHHFEVSSGQQQQQSTQHRIWVQRIRSLLESQQPGARWAGVCFVRITAQQSQAMFTDHVRSWVTLLVGMLSKNESVSSLEAIITTLSELFAKTSKRPDLKSDVSSKYLPDFYNHVLNHRDKKALLPTIFKALAQSVTLFPTTFRLAVDRTEGLCVAYLDGQFSQEPALVKEAATCFAALHRAGGKNPNHPTERFTPSEQWRHNLQEIVKAMHRCLNVLFATVDEDKVDASEIAGRNKYFIGMAQLSSDSIMRYPQTFARFSSLSIALMACLSCPTKDAVHLPLNSLVALLTRIYNIHSNTPMSDARGVDQQEYFSLVSGISSLHLSANEVLKTMLASVPDYLVRHLALLGTISVKAIRISSSSGNGLGGAVGVTSSAFRMSTFSVVEACIRAFGIPYVNMIHAPLMLALLEDLRMPTAKVVNPLELGVTGGAAQRGGQANGPSNKHKGGAGKHRRGNAAAVESLSSMEEIVSPEIFSSALHLLSLVLTTAGPNLPPHARAAADTLVVSHLMNSQFQANPIEQPQMLSTDAALSHNSFYSGPVRAQLYQTLTASVSAPAETLSSLLPLGTALFKAGLNDPEKYVRDQCSTAMTICDLIMHARMPPMQRARTSASQAGAGKSEKPVQEAGETLFGTFGATAIKKTAAGSSVKTFAQAQQNREASFEEEEEEEEEEDEEETGSVEPENRKKQDSTVAMMDVDSKSSQQTIASLAQLSKATMVANEALVSSTRLFKESLVQVNGSETSSSTIATTTTSMTMTSASESNAMDEDDNEEEEGEEEEDAKSLFSSTRTMTTSTTTTTKVTALPTRANEGPEDEDTEIPDIDMGDDDDDDDEEEDD